MLDHPPLDGDEILIPKYGFENVPCFFDHTVIHKEFFAFRMDADAPIT